MEESKHPIKNTISGVLIVDKPIGMTSHQVVQVIRGEHILNVPDIQALWIHVHQACW